MNTEDIIEEIDKFIDRFHLKTNKKTSEDLIKFIEDKWQKADAKKYEIYYSQIIIGRMMNEYIRIKDFGNLMRWIHEYELFDPKSSFHNHPNYIKNYYKGERCLECGNEEKALEYFNLCYAENPDYIFTRSSFCAAFFNTHLENPRELQKEEEPKFQEFYIKLPYWQEFFKENNEIYVNFLGDYGTVYEYKSTDNQNKIISDIEQNQEKILKNILTELLEQYPRLQNIYEYSEEDKPYFMPDLENIKDFSDLLSIHQIYIIEQKNKEPRIGFLFSCSWDNEHGLGVMTYKKNVEDIGGAEVAFC